MLEGDHTFLLHMMRPSHWASPFHDRSFTAERERRGIRDGEHPLQRRTFMLVITISWFGSHLHSCCQEAQRAWIFVISLVLVPALVIAAQPHTRTHVNTNVPSTFLCSGQCVVALSTATGVSFSLFTHPAFVKMPWENRNVEGSSAAEVDKSLRVKTFSPGL